MPQIIDVPGHGQVEFPDSMSDADIVAAIKRNSAPPPVTASDRTQAVGSGANSGIASLAGLPVDTALNIWDLAKAGVGTLQGSLTGKPPSDVFLPADRSQYFGSGDYIRQQMNKTPVTTSQMSRPDDPVSQYLHTAGSALPGVMLSNPTTGAQAVNAVAANVVPTVFSKAVADKTKGTQFENTAPILAALSAAAAMQRAQLPDQAPEDYGVPTTQQLKDKATEAYSKAEKAGVVIAPDSYENAVASIRKAADKAKLNPNLHPKTTAALDVLDESVGKALTLSEADQLRQVLKDAKAAPDAGDRRVASIALNKYDDYLNNLKATDTLAGNAPEAIDALNSAREAYRRKSNAEMLDQIERKAGINAGARYTQGGVDLALRNEFKKLALNDKKMRMFTPEQQAAIEKVATGGTAENLARNLGKFDPTKGGMATLLGTVTGGGLATLAAGPAAAPLGLLLPAAGFAGNRLATRMTLNNADLAREALVGKGLPEIQNSAPMAAQSISGELMPRSPFLLSAPAIIAGMRSAPGTAFAREQMGLTPDVERAGMMHPGVAKEQIPQPLPSLPYRAAPGLLTDQRPMIVDAQGRVSTTRDELRDYLRDTGQDHLRNIRQPNAEPRSGLLGADPITLLEEEARRQRLFEDPTPSAQKKAMEADWLKRYQEAKAKLNS